MAEIVLSLIGGAALFLYAVMNLSETIRDWAGENARVYSAHFTGGETEIKNQIADAHVLFNIPGVLLFVGFVPAD